MSDAAIEAPDKTIKGRKLKVLVLFLVTAISGAAGFFLATSGLIPFGQAQPSNQSQLPDVSEIAYIEIEPIMISLSGDQRVRHLRFRAQLEVEKAAHASITTLLPRVVDVLNTYLRALELEDLQDPLALTKLRGQMLRRIQVVAGREQVRDLLIMEFVLN